jgi:hypothetical protein
MFLKADSPYSYRLILFAGVSFIFQHSEVDAFAETRYSFQASRGQLLDNAPHHYMQKNAIAQWGLGGFLQRLLLFDIMNCRN